MNTFNAALRAHGCGDLRTAEARYLSTLAKNSKHVDALRMLGLLYHQQGKVSLSESFLQRAAGLSPDDAMLLFDLGVVCKQNGKLERAIHWLGRAVACAPTLTAAHACLGEAYLAVGRVDAALDSFRLAVRQDPSDVLALNQLGSALHEVELPHEALAAFRCALALNRDSLAARLGAGTSMCAVEDYESAIGQFEAAIALDDQCAPAWYNLGCCRLGLGQYDAAVEAFTRVLGLHPGWAAAHLNRALAWLSAGDFERGLPEYEWRLGAIDKDFDSAPPRWDGSPLADKVLLIYAEQGLGDTVHFIRFVPSARALADKLILQVQPAILPLIEPLAAQWDITIVDADSEVPADVSCPLMSLPHILGVSLATLSATPLRAPLTAPPAATPYIQVPNAYREKWRGRLNHLGRRKIGLVRISVKVISGFGERDQGRKVVLRGQEIVA